MTRGEGPDSPSITTGMLIRRPAPEVFEAFVDPAVTTRFWFTSSSARLEAGKRLQWNWDMFGVSADVTGKVADPPRRLVFEWGAPASRTEVEITFEERGESATYTTVRVSGFAGDPTEVERQRVDAMGQFSLVLAGAKAVLEHNVDLNLVADRYPDRRA